MARLGELLETGKIRPVIERTSKLSEAPEALRIFDQGHARGKTVITWRNASLGNEAKASSKWTLTRDFGRANFGVPGRIHRLLEID